MSVSRSLKENVSDTPQKINDSLIEFTKIEKWEVSKVSLLQQKKTIEEAIVMHQTYLDEINQLLAMFEEQVRE